MRKNLEGKAFSSRTALLAELGGHKPVNNGLIKTRENVVRGRDICIVVAHKPSVRRKEARSRERSSFSLPQVEWVMGSDFIPRPIYPED